MPEQKRTNREFDLTRQDLDDAIARSTEGFSPGPSYDGALDAFAPLTFPIHRATCYVGALELGSGAAFSEHARKGVTVVTRLGDRPPVEHASAIKGPGAVFKFGCARADGQASVDLVAVFRSAIDKARVHDLGAGAFTLRLYTKAVSESELRSVSEREDTNERRDKAEAAEFKEQQERARAERQHDDERHQDQQRTSVSVTVENECPNQVRLLWGRTPGPGSGTVQVVVGHARASFQTRAGDSVWIPDRFGRPAASATIAPSTRQVVVNSSCAGLSTR